MNEIESLDKVITEVTDKLNDYSVNYVVDVMIVTISESVGDNIEEQIKSVFSTAVLGGISKSNASELHEELLSGLSFAGFSASHPNKKYVGSAEHKQDLENVKSKLKPVLAKSSTVTSFRLDEGNPLFPGYLGFAFLIEGSSNFVIIGACSD